MAEISPTLRMLQLEQADAFRRDAESALIELDALGFYRWTADRQLDDARKFAKAARLEQAKLAKCGRCGQQNVTTVKCGPYTVCEPCAALMNA